MRKLFVAMVAFFLSSSASANYNTVTGFLDHWFVTPQNQKVCVYKILGESVVKYVELTKNCPLTVKEYR
jgi:hypothetical protein